jgi:hypothetical protein
MLVQNINLYVWDCAEDIYIYIYIYIYIPPMFLRECRAAELWVNMLKDNTETDIKIIALMTARTENKLLNI